MNGVLTLLAAYGEHGFVFCYFGNHVLAGVLLACAHDQDDFCDFRYLGKDGQGMRKDALPTYFDKLFIVPGLHTLA